jgi:hypothetical protein
MINPRFEVNRLRQTLIFKGLNDREADYMCELAANDIAVAITELVTSAIDEAANIGQELGVPEFADQIKAVEVGGVFQIVTESGRVDFSVGEKQMLPHLLKNPKRAKDGSLYKVIPMRNKNSSKQIKNIFEAQREQQQAQKIAIDNLKSNKSTGTDPLSSTNMFSGLAAAKDFIARKKELEQMVNKENDSGPKEFRTASSKQNPSEMWVLPAKERDMAAVLVDLNRKLEDDIQTVVQSIVRQYEEIT